MKFIYVIILFTTQLNIRCHGEFCIPKYNVHSYKKAPSHSCPRLGDPPNDEYCCGNITKYLYCCSQQNNSAYKHLHTPPITYNFGLEFLLIVIYGTIIVFLVLADILSTCWLYINNIKKKEYSIT